MGGMPSAPPTPYYGPHLRVRVTIRYADRASAQAASQTVQAWYVVESVNVLTIRRRGRRTLSSTTAAAAVAATASAASPITAGTKLRAHCRHGVACSWQSVNLRPDSVWW